MKREPVKSHVMTIVHGKSEFLICNSIKSNLRIKHEIIARDKGKTSIQINGVMDILQDKRFRSFTDFKRNFPDFEYEKKEIKNFALFIIMDLDDCTEEMQAKYLSREIFAKHWLHKYIVPIYNKPNLERTMEEAGIQVQKKKDYILIFPTNHGDLNLNMAKEFLQKLQKCKCTNMDQYVEYCLSLVKV